MRKSNIYNVVTNNTTVSNLSNEEFNVIVNTITDDLNKLKTIANENGGGGIDNINIEVESLFSNIANNLRKLKRELPDAVKDLWNGLIDKLKKIKDKEKGLSGKDLKATIDQGKQEMGQAFKGLGKINDKLNHLETSNASQIKTLNQLEKQIDDLLASTNNQNIRKMTKEEIDNWFLN